MRYIVFGHRTESECKSGQLGTIISGHYSIVDAVRCMLMYTQSGDWHKCYVAKLVK